MLAVRSLCKSFGGLRAVDGCSFNVAEGTITGLIGPNGAGKTTLYNLLTGYHKADAGQIVFQEEPIQDLPSYQIFQKGVSRTFQITREFGRMTVLENLMMVPKDQIGERFGKAWFSPGAVRRQEEHIRTRALRVLDHIHLIDLQDHYAGTLSGGQKKLLELGKTMMADPTLILLDEPGAGVNRSLMVKLIGIIQDLCKNAGITFLIIEHDMDLVMNLCDPIIVLSEGKKLAEGSPHQIREDQRVLDAYLGGQYR